MARTCANHKWLFVFGIIQCNTEVAQLRHLFF